MYSSNCCCLSSDFSFKSPSLPTNEPKQFFIRYSRSFSIFSSNFEEGDVVVIECLLTDVEDVDNAELFIA